MKLTEKILALLSATVAGPVSREDVGRILGAPSRTTLTDAGGNAYLCWVYSVPGDRLEEFAVSFDHRENVGGFAVFINGSAAKWTETLDGWMAQARGGSHEH